MSFFFPPPCQQPSSFLNAWSQDRSLRFEQWSPFSFDKDAIIRGSEPRKGTSLETDNCNEDRKVIGSTIENPGI